jgi:multidrug efflux pump subunit AcrB
LRVSILTGTLATVFAFLPLRLLGDEIGAYVRSLPIVITISMLASFALAMTVTPTLAAAVLRPPKKTRSDSERRLRPGFRMYAWALRGGMRLRWLVLAGSVAAMVGAIMLVPSVGLSFFPEVDRDQFTIDIWMPEGTGVEGSEAMVLKVEETLRQDPRISSWTSFVGEGGPRFHITVMPQFATLNYARILVNTHEAVGTRALVAELREHFRAEIAGARISPKAILLGIPVEAPIAIKIKGPDLDVARRISHEIQAILRGVPGSDMVRDDIGQEIHSLKIRIDSEAAAMAGISNTEVALALLTANEGLPVTEFRDGDEKVSIVMRAVEEDRKAFRSLDGVWVPSMATGAKVPLRALATVEPQWGAGVINRMNNQRTVTVLSDVSGRLASDVMRDAWPKIEALELPPGFALSSEGEEKERDKAFGDLLVIFAIIVGALLLMLTIQFRSIRQALAVLFSVPLAIIGAILGLWFSGNSFSFMAFLGVVSLAGMVIKNAVVWVEFVDRAVQEGHSFREALVDAGARRLRPIMLTAMTTVGGLLPLGLFGGVLWEGMAWAMIFGLSLATVLTLYVIPVLFYTLFRRDYDRPSEPAGSGQPLDVAVS